MIPSPVNLSTVPSKRVTAAARVEKKRCMIARHSSGSSCSARSIEPLTSANRTVTCLRSASSLTRSFTKGRGYAPGSLVYVRSVLVTGASTGIGRATALRLDADGWRVFAGVRKEADAESLRQEASSSLVPVTLDVTDPEQIAAAAERVERESDGGLDGLVNNAGVAVPGPLETIPLDDLRHQLEVNLIAYVAVTQAMLPQIRRKQGRVVFLASIGGRIAFPFAGPYHASKFATEAIGDVFRQELRPWGIKVAIIEPGSIDTPIWDRGQQKATEVEAKSPQTNLLYGAAIEKFRKVIEDTAERGIPPEKVAKAIAHALESSRPKSRYLVGLDAKVQARLQPLIPTPWFDWIVARQLNL
jgi:NAD(P)-dependent dehydrogenase (short-subunit alcohol dehydrogenase family)